MVLWETEFYAISMVTGKMERFRGMFIQAHTLQAAIEHARAIKLDYLQFTGTWYKDFDHVRMDEEFYNRLPNIREMSYDDFVDWLDLALTKDDLMAVREEVLKIPELSEHLKVIDLQIKLKYGGEKKKGNEEDPEEGETSCSI